MTAIIIRTPQDFVAISDFSRMILRCNSYYMISNIVRNLGYEIISSTSRSGEAILERSGFQKMKRTTT